MKRLLGLLLCFSVSASAQTQRTIQEPDRTVVRKNTTMRFDEVEIGSARARPSDGLITVRHVAVFPNLIKVRGSFTPELQSSVDAL